jgi:hypothetical protein
LKYFANVAILHTCQLYCFRGKKYIYRILISFQDLLVEADLVAAGSLKGVMTGKHYNRSLRTHKVIYEAMMRLLFNSYLHSLPQESQNEIKEFIGTLIYT